MKSSIRLIISRFGLLGVCVALVALAWLAPLDKSANAQIDTGLKRALVTFATARTLNAVISVAQGTEMSVQPLGVGLNLAPGQILSPIHDLIEQFSDVMLTASVAFGVQKILLLVGSHWIVSAALTVSLVLAFGLAHYKRWVAFAWMKRVAVLLLLLRFAVPVVLCGTEVVFDTFLKSEYESSQAALIGATGQVSALESQTKVQSKVQQSLIEKLRDNVSNFDFSTQMQNFKNALENATEHIIKLITLFLVQTVILPLGFLWVLIGVGKQVINRKLILPT